MWVHAEPSQSTKATCAPREKQAMPCSTQRRAQFSVWVHRAYLEAIADLLKESTLRCFNDSSNDSLAVG